MKRRALLSILALCAAARAEDASAPEADWIRDHIPAWLANRSFLLENWQWLALLALAILGIMLGVLVRTGVTAIGRRIARARGVEIDRNKKRGRPFSWVGQGALWLYALPILDLPVRAEDALEIAAHLFLMVGVVWSVCRVVDWISQVLAGMAQTTDTRLDDLLVPMLRKAIKVFVVALGIVWIADSFGQDIAALLAGIGIGGIAIALASKDTVENFFGALAIVADHPFQVGDWIKMGEVEGTVEEVGFRSTRVRTFYNSLVSFPNAMLIRNPVDNLGAREWRRIKTTLGVAYDTPPDTLEAFLEGIREIVRRHPYTRKDYYHVYFNGFGQSSLEILLYVFVRTPDWATELREKQRLFMDILRLADTLGVAFAFPTRTLHMIEDKAALHDTRFDSIDNAHRDGRKSAKEIVDRFTGRDVPPPVVISRRPDDEAGDGNT